MYASGENLNDAIKRNLIAKVNAYADRSTDDRHKVMIFTDNVALWKENANVIIRTDQPLPPIPDNYDRTRVGCDLVEEMKAFIGDYIRPSYKCQNAHFSVLVTGHESEPRLHIIFAPHSLEHHESVLLRSASSEAAKRSFRSGGSGAAKQSFRSEVCGAPKWSHFSHERPGTSEVSSDSAASYHDSSTPVDSASSADDPASKVPAVVVQRRINPSTNVPKILVQHPTIESEGSVETGYSFASPDQALSSNGGDVERRIDSSTSLPKIMIQSATIESEDSDDDDDTLME